MLLGAAPVDVAVQRVGARVQLAVGKPAVERRIGVIEDTLRFTGPCHRPRGVGPEGRGIGDAGVAPVPITAHMGTVARKRLSIVRFMTAEPPPIEGGALMIPRGPRRPLSCHRFGCAESIGSYSELAVLVAPAATTPRDAHGLGKNDDDWRSFNDGVLQHLRKRMETNEGPPPRSRRGPPDFWGLTPRCRQPQR